MSLRAVSLDFAQNRPNIGLSTRRGDAEDVFVQPPVIFPRVHIPRNVGGIDRHAPNFFAVRVEKSAQTFMRVQGEQFLAIDEIN
jgi:hypothetical protein